MGDVKGKQDRPSKEQVGLLAASRKDKLLLLK